ncbi:hypothetical protein CNMCM5793_005181 [Aspergillus hiratsukae]|uniref:Uncharacterized protein n=1 Tax=Aspergillus hiratsukae TaxID=1194566 RepID=A0A8H6Q6Q4_9EURO|nr:hypothetical protein CNMCM5793_005181 [Aspergillus hiratsukae]KAF7166551.1 hypothetical protein CNMCM6106_002326 [Aspergillus hiratsukae]
MAPRPASPLPGTTTASVEAGNSYRYPPMQHGALMLFQAAIAMRDFPRERARNAQLEDANENLQMEIHKLKEKETELKQKIGDLKISNGNLERALEKQANQVKKLEAELKEMSEKKYKDALNSANLAANTDWEDCLEHNTRPKKMQKMKHRLKLLDEAFAAGNDQA